MAIPSIPNLDSGRWDGSCRPAVRRLCHRRRRPATSNVMPFTTLRWSSTMTKGALSGATTRHQPWLPFPIGEHFHLSEDCD
ncbi:MAG: hypothetical protein GC192_01870 [Bacteroidetes bacterium]|nr:hypothetical protein [Bacteroidota bacterium]